MIVKTKHFGEVDISGRDIFVFDAGLPGFEQMKRYIIIEGDDCESPFRWLQCIDEPQLAFAVANPFMILRDYDFVLCDEDADRLGIEKAEDVVTYSILVIPEDYTKISMNLKAPVIININSKKAAQIILDTDKYTVRHYILDELRRLEVGCNAGADKEKGPNDSYK
jgi:flagellar assembly factor FliW